MADLNICVARLFGVLLDSFMFDLWAAHQKIFGFLRNSGFYPRLARLPRKIRAVCLNFRAYKNKPIGCICICIHPKTKRSKLWHRLPQSSSLPQSCAKQKSYVVENDTRAFFAGKNQSVLRLKTYANVNLITFQEIVPSAATQSGLDSCLNYLCRNDWHACSQYFSKSLTLTKENLKRDGGLETRFWRLYSYVFSVSNN